MLSERLKKIAETVASLGSVVAALQRDLDLAKEDWPDHQIRGGAEWRSRDETPPIGWLWASDGDAVWTIHSDGKPIPATAIRVRYWTLAFIPAPPSTLELGLSPAEPANG